MTGAGEAAPVGRVDRLKLLRAFCETVRIGSLAGAAQVLASSQPAVSAQVQALEAALGMVLFRRHGARIAPTRVAADLYRIALPLVEGLLRLPELFEEQHHGVTADTLRIGAGEVSGAYVLPGLVQRFQALHPRTRVEMRVGTGAQRLAWLRGFELDVVVIAIDHVPDDIEFRPLVHADAVVVMPEDHPLAGCDRVALEELGRHRLVALLPGHHLRDSFDVVLRLHGVRPRIALEVEDWGSTLHHVAAGAGIAVVPDLCVSAHEPLRMVRLEHSYAMRVYGVAVRRDALAALAARRFVEVAVSGAPDAGEVR